MQLHSQRPSLREQLTSHEVDTLSTDPPAELCSNPYPLADSQPYLKQTHTTVTSRRAWLNRMLHEWAIQDWFVLLYHCILWFAAFQGAGPYREYCLSCTSALVLIHTTTVVMVRGGLLRNRFFAPLLYRIVVYGGVQISYFLLRDLLPTATPRALDALLYKLDIRIFGIEPTLWTDHFVNPSTTAWFSFFYFSYFFLLASHVVPFLFARRAQLFAEFALTTFLVYCTGHVLYMVVPGYGPYKYLAGAYQHQLPSGFWYNLVLNAVATGGALKDIFPSLHTAGPTAIAIFSFRHRDKLPFKYSWPIVSFFAINIIGATIFLRWHYLIDVIAGLTLASVANLIAMVVSRREYTCRDKQGLSPTWPIFSQNAPWRS